MIIATIAALALSQAPAGWSEQQLNGIYATLAQVQQQIEAGTKPNKTRPTKLNLGGNVGKGKNCMRCYGFYLPPERAAQLGIDPALYTTTTTDPTTGQTVTSVVTARLYATLTVCAGATSSKANKPSWLQYAIDSTCSAPLSSDPGQDAFQIALIDDTENQTAATGSGCACATGPGCQWTRTLIDGSTETIQCPRPLTMNPGTWSGTDVLRVSCVGLLGFNVTPPACTP